MKKILLSILIFAAVLVSCDQENEGPLFDAKGVDYVAVGTTNIADAMALNEDNSYTVSFPLHRTDKLKSGTVANVTLVGDNLFSLENSSVVFAEGEAIAYAKIVPSDQSKIDPAKIYSFELSVEGDNASPLYNKATFSAQLELDLTSLGEGTFTSPIIEDSRTVEVMKANGLEIYKSIGLYEDGLDILFVEDVTAGTIVVAAQKAWNHSAGYEVYVKGTGAVATNGDGKKVYTLSIEHFIPTIEHSFGTFSEELIFP